MNTTRTISIIWKSDKKRIKRYEKWNEMQKQDILINIFGIIRKENKVWRQSLSDCWQSSNKYGNLFTSFLHYVFYPCFKFLTTFAYNEWRLKHNKIFNSQLPYEYSRTWQRYRVAEEQCLLGTETVVSLITLHEISNTVYLILKGKEILKLSIFVKRVLHSLVHGAHVTFVMRILDYLLVDVCMGVMYIKIIKIK